MAPTDRGAGVHFTSDEAFDAGGWDAPRQGSRINDPLLTLDESGMQSMMGLMPGDVEMIDSSSAQSPIEMKDDDDLDGPESDPSTEGTPTPRR